MDADKEHETGKSWMWTSNILTRNYSNYCYCYYYDTHTHTENPTKNSSIQILNAEKLNLISLKVKKYVQVYIIQYRQDC